MPGEALDPPREQGCRGFWDSPIIIVPELVLSLPNEALVKLGRRPAHVGPILFYKIN